MHALAISAGIAMGLLQCCLTMIERRPHLPFVPLQPFLQLCCVTVIRLSCAWNMTIAALLQAFPVEKSY